MDEHKPESDLGFRLMAITLRLREWFMDADKDLMEVGLRRGQTVLDYGCGVGSYALPAARLVGQEGTVYALDIHPLAIEAVQRRARKQGLANIHTIRSGLDTGLADGSVDIVLLYDVVHAVNNKLALLRELYRVLRPGGTLSLKPDHVEADRLVELVTASGLGLSRSHAGKVWDFERPAAGDA
jgi:ubiquinone/menaquinone biosynthesis C-methylase UbiE